jgi:hypothetical protein
MTGQSASCRSSSRRFSPVVWQVFTSDRAGDGWTSGGHGPGTDRGLTVHHRHDHWRPVDPPGLVEGPITRRRRDPHWSADRPSVVIAAPITIHRSVIQRSSGDRWNSFGRTLVALVKARRLSEMQVSRSTTYPPTTGDRSRGDT